MTFYFCQISSNDKLLFPLYCNVVNGCAYKVLGKDLCIKEVDVYSVLAWIISITDMK